MSLLITDYRGHCHTFNYLAFLRNSLIILTQITGEEQKT